MIDHNVENSSDTVETKPNGSKNINKKKLNKKNIAILAISILALIGILSATAFYFVTQNNRLAYSTELQNSKLKEADDYLNNHSSVTLENFNPERGELYGKIRIPSVNIEVALAEGLPKDGRETLENQDLLDNTAAHLEGTKHPGQNSQIYVAGHNYLQFNELKDLKDGAEIYIDMPYGTYKYITKAAPVNGTNEQVGMIVHQSHVEAIQTNLSYEELVIQSCYPLDAQGEVEERFLVYAYPEGKTANVSFPGYRDGSAKPNEPVSGKTESTESVSESASTVKSF